MPSTDLVLPKPMNMPFEQAVTGVRNLFTAIQPTRRDIVLRPKLFLDGTLDGKTALMTAGPGALTSVATQYAQKVMGAQEVIATVSTIKMSLLKQLMPGVFDCVVDHQTQDIMEVMGRDQVYFSTTPA